MYIKNNTMMPYERMDSCCGVVIRRCQKGVFLKLDNGEQAFAYRFGNLLVGTKVLCSVLKPAAGGLLTRVSIDSVEYAVA